MILLQAAAIGLAIGLETWVETWLDWLGSHGWVVALGVGVLVFLVSLTFGRRPIAMPVRPRGGYTPEETVRRAALFAEVGASPAVADALAQGNRVLAIKRYREEHAAGRAEGARAIDALIADAVKKPLIAAGASPAIASALAQGKRINAIKLYRQERHVGLRDAAEAIDRLVRVAHSRAAGDP